MNCEMARERLGEYLDGEVPPDVQRELERHLAECRGCALDLAALRDLAMRIATSPLSGVPAEIWDAIERRLPDPSTSKGRRWHRFATRRGIALAASFLLLIGVGTMSLIWSDGGASSASAATIDFGALLDDLSGGPEGAFEKFVSMHNGRSISAEEAIRTSPQLDFEIPDTLPGGFQLQKVFSLRFGKDTGVAACYARGTEFLATIFHAPVKQEDFGTHKDYPCVVGQHRGHKVDVGDWKLVHLTDAATCHCILSRLDEMHELPLVFSKVAPRSKPNSAPESHSHDDQP